MMEQFDLFSAREAKRDGMERVELNADERWKAKMYEAVIAVARSQPYFTSDDVYFHALRRGLDAVTHDDRAFGPVMMRAAREGVCVKANCAPVPSRRRTLHASPRSVWSSLLYKK
jgi:hypothetical protein